LDSFTGRTKTAVVRVCFGVSYHLTNRYFFVIVTMLALTVRTAAIYSPFEDQQRQWTQKHSFVRRSFY